MDVDGSARCVGTGGGGGGGGSGRGMCASMSGIAYIVVNCSMSSMFVGCSSEYGIDDEPEPEDAPEPEAEPDADAADEG